MLRASPTQPRLVPLLALALALSLSACEGGNADGEAGETSDQLSHAADIQPIWDANCVTYCHEPGGLHEALDLTDGYATLVNGASAQATGDLVDPGSPTTSYVLAKLRGTQLEYGGQGTQMPAGGAAPLTAAQIDLVEAWIEAGAAP